MSDLKTSHNIWIQSFLSARYIPLNAANKKTDQWHSVFQTSTNAAAHATLETELLFFSDDNSYGGYYYLLAGPDGEVIPILKLQDLLYMIHNILDTAVSK